MASAFSRALTGEDGRGQSDGRLVPMANVGALTHNSEWSRGGMTKALGGGSRRLPSRFLFVLGGDLVPCNVRNGCLAGVSVVQDGGL